MGFIRDSLVIKPVPNSIVKVWNEYFRKDVKSRITRGTKERPFVTGLHFVIKRRATEESTRGKKIIYLNHILINFYLKFI